MPNEMGQRRRALVVPAHVAIDFSASVCATLGIRGFARMMAMTKPANAPATMKPKPRTLAMPNDTRDVPTPLVPPDTEAIEWARELDRAARRHDDARGLRERQAALMVLDTLLLDDERMVQIARALLARVGAQGDGK